MNLHEIFVQITGKGDDAEDALDKVAAKMVAAGKIHTEAKLSVEATAANAQIDEVIAKLLLADHITANPEIKLNAQAAILQLLMAKKAIGDFDRNVTQSTNRTGRFRNALTDLAETLKPDSVHIGSFTFSLSRAGVAILFVAGTIIKSLIGALAALASSLAQAIGGLGALAAAAAAAVGPMLALGIATISRFKQAKQATDDLRAAILKLHTAEQTEHDARRSLADAIRQETAAQQNLARVRRESAQQARQDLADALAAVQDAEQGVADAQRDALDAQTALSAAREEATRQLQDLRLAAEGAALGEKEAALQLERARNQLREMERNPHTPNVALREQRLAVQEAELGVKNARRENQRSQEDLNNAEAKGIHNSEIMVQARRDLADANQAVKDSMDALTESQQDLNRVERDAARRNEQIVAARHALQDANRQVADSQRRLQLATEKVARAQHKVNQLQAQAAEFGPGSAARELRQAAREFRNAFLDITKIGSDRIFRGITRGLENLKAALPALKDEFSDLGKAIGRMFERVGREFASQKWVRFFEQFTRLATRLTGPATRAFLNFAKIMANIARAAKPFLIAGLKAFGDALGGIADKTGDIGKTRAAIGEMVSNIMPMVNLLLSIINLISAFAAAAAPAGKELAGWLTDSANNMADFLRSSEGTQAVTDFFNDTIPLVKQVTGLIGELLIAFIQFSQIVAPLLAPALGVLRAMLHIVNRMLSVVQDLPEPFQIVLAGLILWQGPLKLIRLALKGIKTLLSAILLGKWGKLLGRGGGLAGKFETLGLWALYAWDGIKKVAVLVAGRLMGAFRGLIALGVGGAMRAIGVRMLALAAEGGPIGLLIAALVILILKWNEVKEAIGGAVDKLKDWMSVQKLLSGEKLNEALGKVKDLVNQVGQMTDRRTQGGPGRGTSGGSGKLQDAANEAGKTALKALGEGMKRAARHVDPVTSGKMSTALAENLRRNLKAGSQHGGGLTMHNHFITSSGKHADDREAVAAISRRLRQRGLSIA